MRAPGDLRRIDLAEVHALTPTIKPEFRDLIPPLPADAREQLERDLVAHGCREPLSVWRGFLVDGHNRLEICTRLGIEYSTVDYSSSPLLADEASVLRWICDNQLARRNLTPFQASYLRGKRYLLARAESDRGGQNVHHGERGQFAEQPERRGKTRDLVAAETGVVGRTISRDREYAEDLDAIAASAGIDVRNALLRGDVKVTRTAIHEIATRAPTSLEDLRRAAVELRGQRPSTRRVAAGTRVFFQRSIKEFIRDEKGTITHAKLAVCGHVVPHRARSGDVTKSKTKSCTPCGSGSRPAWERARRRVQLEAMVKAAANDPHRFPHLCDFVSAAIDVLTVPPMSERMRDLWDRIDRASISGRLVESPNEAGNR